MVKQNLFSGQEQRCRHREWTCGHHGGRGGWDKFGDQVGHIYTTMHQIDSQWEQTIKHRKLSSVFCDDLDGWVGVGVGGRSKRVGVQVYIQLIHFTVQHKLRQHCKAIILQLKKKMKHSRERIPLRNMLQKSRRGLPWWRSG